MRPILARSDAYEFSLAQNPFDSHRLNCDCLLLPQPYRLADQLYVERWRIPLQSHAIFVVSYYFNGSFNIFGRNDSEIYNKTFVWGLVHSS